MAKKHILFINGIPDDGALKIDQIHKNGNIKWSGSGSANLINFLKNDYFSRSSIIMDTRKDQKIPRQMIHGVFNQISDPDTHKISLQKTEDFYQAVSKHLPFFNPPSLVMQTTRDNIYRMLQGIDKLRVPKTVKIQPRSPSDIYEVIKNEKFEYPVIFRQAGDHGGISTIRVDNDREVFSPFALDGRDYYLTQFVDYTDQEGIYGKYRLVVVDGEVYIRHAIFSREWMVHAGSQLDKEESQKYKKAIANRFTKEIKPRIQPIITEIYHRLKLDYFGIDCNIDENMNLLIFEINANMNVFTKSKKTLFSKHIEMIRSALVEMLRDKGK
ncbi:ATP-grasp domain-containing protein [Sulfurovum mangrovi]|uniref:ATP-grasp domain-containing protein n=1 Tax=Sulfurovum mangrovi TaxID=2893889 RepID=UPI001E3AFF7B|nr:hypothetical protein [Sulfurovum mangrovi]UFH58977.1 hypothetical protein LN246_11590 [Sulfurovum mangrovi]